MPQAVAAALSVSEGPDRPLIDTLVETLQPKQMLLVLDNCEHLVDAAIHLTETLLGSCPGLWILVTSREVLGARDEATWPVPPLSGPEPQHQHTPEELVEYESVRLFVERVRDPAFVLTSENAGAGICQRLDGLPLAIELAAARVETLGVAEISARLEDSLELLTGGGRTATRRQRTLRGALDWSHELLSEPERMLFRRLSAFAGGWRPEAAEAVGIGSGIEESEVLNLISQLVDKSLVATEDGGVRFRMLEPVRQYAQEHLDESGEGDVVRSRHAEFFLGLAEEVEPELRGARQEAWLQRLKTEHANLRAALRWALERGEAELGLRLGGALGEFWHVSGHQSEGRRWLEAALDNGEDAALASSPTRAKVLVRVGAIAWQQGDYERAVALNEEALALARDVGDAQSAAAALYSLGSLAMFRNQLERA